MDTTALTDRINALWDKRQARLKLQKEVDAMEEAEKAEVVQLTIALKTAGLKDVPGTVAEFKLKPTEEPTVADWIAFHQHIRMSGELDLLQKRPMVSAIKERWQVGLDVPGIERDRDIVGVLVKRKA